MATSDPDPTPASAPAPAPEQPLTATLPQESPASLPSPPFLHVPGLVNLRDAGGHSVVVVGGGDDSHATVRRGVLYRSADLTALGDEGRAALARLGIARVFDLRSAVELSKTGEPVPPPADVWPGATRLFVPVFLEKDYSPEALATRFRAYSDGPEGFVKAYAAILASAADPENPYAPFRTVLEHLASPTGPPAPLLIHCTAGKDRTGVLIALILSLLNVPDSVIADEYSLTDLGLAPRREGIINRLVEGDALGGDRTRAENMVRARKENMLLTLEHLRARYGSAERYVIDHLGLPEESVARIRQNLLVRADGGEPEEARL
ncbi:hypothetical protein VTJ83DRAFT_1545 [Remersonia thermophila]|uniref:Tyrosine specific protein phosphatases domain-containing protein n=1 Tax=Remersonia thermophila TaxID=72144 RepID=A0ABR4DHQ6_9PEZI